MNIREGERKTRNVRIFGELIVPENIVSGKSELPEFQSMNDEIS